MKLDKRDFIINTDYDQETITFEHCPTEERAFNSSGKLTFDSLYQVCKGDGHLTPDFTDATFSSFEFEQITALKGENKLEEIPNEYKEAILNVLINQL